MSSRLIASDMDRTFLSDAKACHRQRFLARHQRMSRTITRKACCILLMILNRKAPFA